MSQDNQPVVIHVNQESIASSSTSLRESLLEYSMENGRTYHKYKDGGLTQTLWLLVTDNKLGLAPLCQNGARVGRVLDIGTGTGIWALDSETSIPRLR
ncbi:methyltransferase domain-containing protein [Colletotrichum incanum]|uniref:Methyltransferase domain-containing protein n=1 Tax=Colletotrichum incanum TaxID=1573173 RepID=A0A162N3U3_COLIC|nr:methyltransferase domain-containing protein [Colletotrichum incanum]